MGQKKNNDATNADKEGFEVELIPVKQDEFSAKRSKESARKILGIMLASLHKKGRPTKKDTQGQSYVF